MTRQSSFGDSQVTNTGRWTHSRVTQATSHAWCSTREWKSFYRTQKIAQCASGICNAVFKSINRARILTDTGSWTATQLSTTSQLAMTTEWMFSSWKGNATLPTVLAALSSSWRLKISIYMTCQPSKRRSWPQSKRAGSKSSWINLRKFTTMYSVRVDTT